MEINSADLGELFSIFHDGVVISHEAEMATLVLEVEILYLAERVQPGFQTFRITLQDAGSLSFVTWPNDPKASPSVLLKAGEIFKPELDILSGELVTKGFKIIFNQSSPAFDYCGGELTLNASAAQVLDEGGKEYSIEELRMICSEYWREWSSKGPNDGRPPNLALDPGPQP